MQKILLSSEASLTATNWPPGRAADSHLFRNCRVTNSHHNIYYAIYSSPPPLESSGIELEAWSSSSDRRYDPLPQPREAWRERRRARPAPAAHFHRPVHLCAQLAASPRTFSARERMPRAPPPLIEAGLFPRSRCSHCSSPAFASQVSDVSQDDPTRVSCMSSWRRRSRPSRGGGGACPLPAQSLGCLRVSFTDLIASCDIRLRLPARSMLAEWRAGHTTARSRVPPVLWQAGAAPI